MIGVKTIAVIALSAGTIAIAAADGDLGIERFTQLSAGSAFAIGLFAALTAALAGWSARPEIESRVALAIDRGRPILVFEPEPGTVRELPAVAQRLLFVGVFACIALATFTNEATARIAAVPSELARPSRAEYCHDAKPETPVGRGQDAKPVIAPVDQAGCALVKRAFELGYAKTLGSCAPQAIAVSAPVASPAREVCTRRQLDEPFAHYAWRRVVDMATDASPIDSTTTRIGELRTRLPYVPDLLADIQHSITGTPHGSHHLWVTLPDPHPSSLRDQLTGHPPCASRFADLPLWPRWTAATTPGAVFEHVLGQLLFATRFGTPASCTDYTIHWSAPRDACTRLAADPTGFLDGEGALASIRQVLDRRARQLAIRRLADDLGHAQTLPVPPDARAVVSVGCFVVDPQGTGGSSRDVSLDGETIAVRELRAPAIRATGRGPLDVYLQLALLLGGKPYAGPAVSGADRVTLLAERPELGNPFFLLLRLEPLVEVDPFLDRSVLLEQPDVVDVYPFEQHLFAFVDAFRRVYLPQRGRL